MTANPQTTAPTTEAGAVQQAAGIGVGSRWVGRIALLALGVVLLFVLTYAFAWFKASSLSTRFMADADKSYAEGNYIQALTGYEQFDEATNSYVTYGGYMKVARIWSDPSANPRPASYEQANQRITEIMNDRLTTQDVEGFVQANVGKQNPYLGIMYLRLGELYEKEGDTSSAKDVYKDVVDSFPNEPDLISKANEHLQRLGP